MDFVETSNGLLAGVFPALAGFGGVRHGVFTRKGGRSTGPFASLNCSKNVGDDPAMVAANRLQVAEALGAQSLVLLNQVHGRRVLVLPRGAQGPRVWETGEDADAVVCLEPGLFAAVGIADCQPILFLDPVARVAAAAHSGWRGSLQDVAGATVSAMAGAGCVPARIIACVGPSLGPCCAEFINFKTEIPERFWKYRVSEHHFDFWAVTADQLESAGLAPENIHIARICTACRTGLFYSYRKERATGRSLAAIGIMP